MRVAVTGATGFIGSHLLDSLQARGDEIGAWIRPSSSSSDLLPHSSHRFEIDLLDKTSILSTLNNFKPDVICHLAAQSLPSKSWDAPEATMHFNITSALNIFDAARAAHFTGPILVAGSSSEYAPQVDDKMPMDENYPLGANSPYAVSKIAVDQLAKLYHKRYGLKIIRMRPFFWIGPRKTGDFSSDMARRIVEIEQGRADCLRTGNLDAIRDFLDVRDGVDAMLALIDHGQAGEAYNVCSGKGYRLGDLLQVYLGLTSQKMRTEVDPNLVRALDEPVRTGDPRKIMTLGWCPRRKIEETLKEILQFWHARAA